MDFPALVYISPGDHKGHGGTFNYLQVCDEEELKIAISNGYYPTPGIAIDVPKGFTWGDHHEFGDAIGAATDDVTDDVPTREELEAKAKELKIKFNKNTTDDELLASISEELSKGD